VTETSNDIYGELSVADDTVTGSPMDVVGDRAAATGSV